MSSSRDHLLRGSLCLFVIRMYLPLRSAGSGILHLLVAPDVVQTLRLPTNMSQAIALIWIGLGEGKSI